MPFYKVNMMGGFRVPDKELALSEGHVYEFSEDEVTESRGLAAALRDRWLVQTDKDGKPILKAKAKKQSPHRPRPLAEEADMYPDGEPKDENAEFDRVNEEEAALHFDSDFGPSDLDTVATPSGHVGPKKTSTVKKQSKSRPKASKSRKSRRRRSE